MLFRQDVLRRILRGEITLAFRRWRRPTVRAGGTLRSALGVLAIDAVDPIEARAITTHEAAQAGFDDRDALLRELRGEGTLYRIALRYQGHDPRVALREQTAPADEASLLRAKLTAMDRRAERGPWTRATLQLLHEQPGVRAGDLAARQGVPTDQFKRDVRKLKDLGLTESLEVGYRLSARGADLLATWPPLQIDPDGQGM